MKANKQGFANTDLQIEGYNAYPDISDNIQQTLARLLGFDANNQIYRALLTDPDGRLYVSTSATQAASAVNSQVTVGVVSVALVSQNNSRRSLTIQNLGAAPIYLAYGQAALVATGIQIPSNGIYIEDRYLGAVNAISSAAGNDVRILEI